MADKFKAVWVSHSSIADFLKCPRLYYLRNVYKDPKTGHKVTIMTPPLALGQAVHAVIESLSVLPLEERFKTKISDIYDKEWKKVSGEFGGFTSSEQESEYKERGRKMLQKIFDNPGPLKNKAVKIRADGGLPYYWLSEEDNIILCGKIDWIEYLDPFDSVHIIDFKTGKNEEDEESLQLPIYYLLAKNLQTRDISKISYWYLDNEKSLIEMKLPDENEAYKKVLEIARRIKLGRQIEHLKCPKGGCFACRPLEEVLAGKGKLIGVSEYKQDIYML
ncbi:MAG TPA: PD-(D/E)XK nuclease family protein [Candidatus Saccharimonadales bacterium]|nr:PD-(D/E)XK nuclease family protein [Candidatus Saccharimonadales bacterium]